jgi:AraC family transcriptional regulator of adaptative response / DNA-3-methyladenine glycosylase II
MSTQRLDADACYRALSARDPRFDGKFFTAVRTTGVFCRPICPARTPLRRNCRFYPSAAAALEEGFRPCLRCRPELAPEIADANGAQGLISAALRLLAEVDADQRALAAVAARLGVSDRHLRRLFADYLGASPIAVAQSRRVLLAKQLIERSSLPLADVAFAAGYGSLRRFNAAIRGAYGCAPSTLRAAKMGGTDEPLRLRLPYSAPYRWKELLGFIGPRAFPGVEQVSGATYRRALLTEHGPAIVAVTQDPRTEYLALEVRAADVRSLPMLLERARRFFDTSANPSAIAAQLARDPTLRPLLKKVAGMRIPGAWHPFELAVRAIIGQQVSVKAATTLASRLMIKYGAPLPERLDAQGELVRGFPEAATLARADLTSIGLVRTRANAINALAGALAANPALFDRWHSLEEAVKALVDLPGIGEWTAHYIAMRALREPDAFPVADLGLMRAYGRLAGRDVTAKELQTIAERWRPWRAYAAMMLWMSDPVAGG